MFLRKNKNHMHMIGHDHIFVHGHFREMLRYGCYPLRGHLADAVWLACRTKHTLLMMRAYRHEIMICGFIIVILQTGILARTKNFVIHGV